MKKEKDLHHPIEAAMAAATARVEQMQQAGELHWPSQITSEDELDDHFDELTRVYKQTFWERGLPWPPPAVDDLEEGVQRGQGDDILLLVPTKQYQELSPPPTPPAEPDNEELAFETLLREAVDTLFTQRVVVECMQGMEQDDLAQTLIRERRQEVHKTLENTAHLLMGQFLIDFGDLKDKRSQAMSGTEEQRPTISTPPSRPDTSQRIE